MRFLSPRKGLTLIEVVVALLVCSVGALAALGTQATMIRERGRARAVHYQVTVGSRVLDSMATLSCSALANGALTGASAAYSWRVTHGPLSTEIVLSVTPTHGTTTPWSVRSVVRCQ